MSNILFVGIKGSGMSSLALILKQQGNLVFGIDKCEYFQPQEKLIQSNIKIFEGFSVANIDIKIDRVIYSSAYEKHKLVIELKEIYPTISYNDYLAYLTKLSNSYGVSGTHGKTTTAAATTYALSYKNRKDFPFYSIYGSSLIDSPSFTYQGNESLLIEACEYRDHFLKYSLNGAIITSIDFDHSDYFTDLNSVIKSFLDFIINLKPAAFLILNVDDRNIRANLSTIKSLRDDLNIITFGFNDNSQFRIERDSYTNKYKIKLTRNEYFDFAYNDRAILDDIVGAAILSTCMLLDTKSVNLYLDNEDIILDEIFTTLFRISLKALETFPGVKGRLELKAINNNVVYIDDYAHHPKEIYSLITELKARYPGRKLFAIFSAHTASRTKALYEDFLHVFLLFDKLVITKTFASARMDEEPQDLAKRLVRDLNKKLLKSYKVRLGAAIYVDSDSETPSVAASMVEEGDIVISLGASNNDNLYRQIIKQIKGDKDL